MKPFYCIVRSITKVIFKLLYRVKVYGLEHDYKKGAVIAPNHTSFFDPPIASVFWPHEVHFLASDYLFKPKLFGPLIRALNAHPVHRGAQDLKSIKTVCSILEEEKQVIIFPEGERTTDGKLSSLKPGIAMICLRAKAAIIPTYIHGAFEIWPRGQKLPKLWGKMAIVYGSPILVEDLEDTDKKEQQRRIMHKLDQKLHQLQKWYKEGAQGTPP